MILHLVKKEYLLAKKFIVIMMFTIIAVPLFFMWRIPTLPPSIALIYMVVFSELMIEQTVALQEAKYPKAAALLCAVSYPREKYVQAKYLFALLIFAYCFAAFCAVVFIVKQYSMPSLNSVLSVLLLTMVFCGTFIPLQLKFGIEKIQFAFTAAIYVISFGIPAIFTFFNKLNIDISKIPAIPSAVQTILIAAAIVLVLLISERISIGIYSKKEL